MKYNGHPLDWDENSLQYRGVTYELTHLRQGDWITVKARLGLVEVAHGACMVGGSEWCAWATGKTDGYQHPCLGIVLIQAILEETT